MKKQSIKRRYIRRRDYRDDKQHNQDLSPYPAYLYFKRSKPIRVDYHKDWRLSSQIKLANSFSCFRTRKFRDIFFYNKNYRDIESYMWHRPQSLNVSISNLINHK